MEFGAQRQFIDVAVVREQTRFSSKNFVLWGKAIFESGKRATFPGIGNESTRSSHGREGTAMTRQLREQCAQVQKEARYAFA